MENQEELQIKPLYVRGSSGKNVNEELKEQEEINYFAINKPNSARRQRPTFDETNFTKKTTDEETKRHKSSRTYRNDGFKDFETPMHKSSDYQYLSYTYSEGISPAAKHSGVIKDYTSILDPESASTSPRSSKKTKTKTPVGDEARHMIKSMYKNGGNIDEGFSQQSEMARIYPTDLSSTLKPPRPYAKRKTSPDQLRKSAELSNFFRQSAKKK